MARRSQQYLFPIPPGTLHHSAIALLLGLSGCSASTDGTTSDESSESGDEAFDDARVPLDPTSGATSSNTPPSDSVGPDKVNDPVVPLDPSDPMPIPTPDAPPTGTEGPTTLPCEYPAPPYASTGEKGEPYIGRALPPDTTWTGYDTDGTYKTMSLRDLQDCDGSKGTNLIILKNTSPTCGVCTSILQSWNRRLAPGGDWYDQGVSAHALITYDHDWNQDEASMTAITHAYFEEYQPEGWGVWPEPTVIFYKSGFGVIPIAACIDPRTMLIEGLTQGGWYPNSDRFPSMPDGCAAVLERNAP